MRGKTLRRSAAKRRWIAERHGVTAVEFAFTVPLVFVLFFSVIEVSRLLMADGNVNSALLIGIRKASLIESTPAEVEQSIRNELGMLGIADLTVQFDPANFGPNDTVVGISIDVPINGNNGFSSTRVIAPGSVISKSIRFVRENK